MSQQQSQKGAVLIIVLMIMVLMATASLIAIRSTQTSLDLTTTYQINQLLFQASDVPLLNIERFLQDKKRLKQLTSDSGPFGYLSQENPKQALAEYIICFKPEKSALNYHPSTSKIIDGSGINHNPKRYCNINNAQSNHYNSERKIIVTQLSFIRLNVATNKAKVTGEDIKSHTIAPFNGTIGQDLIEERTAHIRLYVTSIMPSFSRSPLAAVDACLAKPIGRINSINPVLHKAESQTQCLKRTGTPFNTQVQDYVFTLKAVPKF